MIRVLSRVRGLPAVASLITVMTIFLLVRLLTRDVSATATPCSQSTGRAMAKYDRIKCRKLPLGRQLTIKCPENVRRPVWMKNGKMLNEITHPSLNISLIDLDDYGVYRCSNIDEKLTNFTYFLFPIDCQSITTIAIAKLV